jgi:hypothetical protein
MDLVSLRGRSPWDSMIVGTTPSLGGLATTLAAGGKAAHPAKVKIHAIDQSIARKRCPWTALGRALFTAVSLSE